MVSDHYLEVKSAQLINKNGFYKNKQRQKYGNFEFTRKGQLTELIENNGIVVFVIRWGEQKIILGSLEAKKLLPVRRYYTPYDIYKLHPKLIDELAEGLK